MGLFGRKTGRTQPMAVGLYGKHPSAGDFLRIEAGGEELQRWDKWLSAALVRGAKLAGDWPTLYETAPLTHFIWPSRTEKGPQVAIVGCMAPSCDQSGRQYPLAIFSEIEQRHVLDAAYFLPFSRFLRDAESLLLRRGDLSRDELLEEVRDLEALGAEDLELAKRVYGQFVDETDSARLFDSIAETWPGQNVTGALSALKDYGETLGTGGIPQYALRCPLNQDALGTGATWLSLLSQAAQGPLATWVLWSRGTMLIGCRQPPESALATLWNPEILDDSVYDLASTDAGQDYDGPLPQAGMPLRELLAQRDA